MPKIQTCIIISIFSYVKFTILLSHPSILSFCALSKLQVVVDFLQQALGTLEALAERKDHKITNFIKTIWGTKQTKSYQNRYTPSFHSTDPHHGTIKNYLSRSTKLFIKEET